MEDTVVTYTAIVINGSVRIQDTVAAYLCTASYGSVRMKRSIVTDFSVVAYTSKRSNVYVVTDLCSRSDAPSLSIMRRRRKRIPQRVTRLLL